MTYIELDENLHLEIVNPFMADDLFEIIDKNRNYLSKYLGWTEFTKSPDDSHSFIKGSLKLFSEKKQIDYFIFYKSSLIGIIGIWENNSNTQTWEIGYWIIEDYSKKGIMTKCVQKIINIGFLIIKAKKIEISCAIENDGSNRIARKVGMTLEGTIRNAEKIRDSVYDHNKYGLLISEYN